MEMLNDAMQKKVLTVNGISSRLISLMGTSIPATPSKFAIGV